MNTIYVFLSIVFINIKISSHDNKRLVTCCFLAFCFPINNGRFYDKIAARYLSNQYYVKKTNQGEGLRLFILCKLYTISIYEMMIYVNRF
jgi:hypothetical protein